MEFAPLNTHYKGRFTPEVEQALRDAGWFPGRVVSNQQALKWLTVESPYADYCWSGNEPVQSGINQIRMFPAAWRALREFGSLTYKQKSDGDTWYLQGFTIDPLEKDWIGDDGWFLDRWLAGGALFPLGYDKESLYAITGDGKVITSEDALIGNTIDEAITNLVLNRGLEYDYDLGWFYDISVFLGLVNTMRSKGPVCGPTMQFEPLDIENEGRFPPEVEQVLREGGWFPGRVVSDEQALQWLTLEKSCGEEARHFPKSGVIQLHMFPMAWQILREFGGLSFKQKSGEDTWHQHGFTIDALEGLKRVDTFNWIFDEWEANGTLFPIGQDRETILLVTGEGKVINDDGILFGNTIDEAITNLVLRNFTKYESDSELSDEVNNILISIQKS